MNSIKTCLLITAFFCGIITTYAQKSTEADEAYIRKARLSSNAAIGKKDVPGVSNYWMNNYVKISSDGSVISGKNNVSEDWKKMFKMDPTLSFERTLLQLSFSLDGKLAIEKGILKYLSRKYEGFYTAIWRKVDGVWMTQMENFVPLL